MTAQADAVFADLDAQAQADADRRADVELTGADDPTGPYQHQVVNPVESFRWLLAELGRRGLSGAFLRGDVAVFTTRIGRDGYIPPPSSPPGTPAHKLNHNGPATIRPINARQLRARIALAYTVWRWTKGQPPVRAEMFFPGEACDLALAAPDQARHLRPLHGVTHTPIARADGTILDTPGYDEASGFLLLPDVEVAPVPTNPTPAELAAATRLLRGMVDEFGWSTDHDEANYLGALLTPLLRLMCPPPYKLLALMAHQPGSGKSLLNQILCDVHGGVFRSELPHDDAELEKSISSILSQTTAPIVQFDNVSGTLRSSRLAGLLTSAVYSGRLLGSTNNTDMVNDRLWTITGNNLNLGGDLVRRALWCTINPGVPDPHLRTGFRLDLSRYARANRGAILHALLTWVAAWAAAGHPRPSLSSSDSYAHWTATVRGILAHAGIPGTFDAAESAQQKVGADDEGWGEFLNAVDHVFGERPFTTKHLVAAMSLGADRASITALTDALPGPLHDRWLKSGTAGIARPLGVWLRNRQGRWAGDVVCEDAGRDEAANVALWKVRHRDGESR